VRRLGGRFDRPMAPSNPLLEPPLSPAEAAACAADVLRQSRAVAIHGKGCVAAQLAACRWQSPVRGIVVAHNGPLTDEQKMWVVLRSGPRGTMLFGLSAAELAGLKGLSPDHLAIVIPGASRSCRRRQLALPDDWEVDLHWSTKLGPEDVHPTAVPPRTRLARSLVDAASEPVATRRARVIVLAGVQQRLVRPPELWDALSRRGRCRNRAIIAESIADAVGGIESLPEKDFDRIRISRGLPAARRQAVLRQPDGHYFLDADWPDYGIRVEIHGIPHNEVRNWDRDLLRQNDISIEGGLLIFSSYATRHLEGRVGDQLVRMFRSRGWTGG